MFITYLKDTKGDKREFISKEEPAQHVSQLVNELSIKHALGRQCTHHVGLIPTQHDANNIYSLIKLMSLNKVRTTESTQWKATARTTSIVSCDKQDQLWEDTIQQSINPLTPNDL
jgi:hypothetical protein